MCGFVAKKCLFGGTTSVPRAKQIVVTKLVARQVCREDFHLNLLPGNPAALGVLLEC